MTLKNKINLSIAILLLLIISLFVFLIWPLFSEIKKSSRDFLSQKQKLSILQTKTENLEKFKNSLPEIKINLEKIDTLLIDPEVPVDFIRFLEKTAQDCNLHLTLSTTPLQKIKEDPWSSLFFQITLLGSFPNFLKFLEKLESSNYLIEIQNSNIARISETELKSKEFEKLVLGDVKATISLKVFTK